MVELALLLPIFVLLLLAVFVIGRYFDLQISLDMAVAEALRAESFGYNGKKVFYDEWKNLTGLDVKKVNCHITKNLNVITVTASTEIELPPYFERFKIPNPKVKSKLSQVISLTRK